MNLKVWIQAARLRTLPLAISNMAMGNGLAAIDGKFSWMIALLSIGTAVSLQILSNFSNDYGDSIHGADSIERTGPLRAVQSGDILPAQMRTAMMFWSVISLILGTALIFVALDGMLLRLIFLVLGLIAIWASINYTAGSKPYGYSGKGDISVFFFFGILAVLGCYYLQTNSLSWDVILPAISCGALSVGVLNLNNIRDISSDKKAGKMSIPVRIGYDAAIQYHGMLLIVAIVSALAYVFANYVHPGQFLFLLTAPILWWQYVQIQHVVASKELDPFLKKLALTTALFVLLFLLGHLLFL